MDEAVSKPNHAEEGVHLLDYIIVLAKHSRMIIYTSMAMTVLTYLFLFFSPNQYTAKARYLPPQQNMTLSAQLLDSLGGGVTPAGNSGRGMGLFGSFWGLKSPGDLYVGMMQGDTIADRIIKRFNLLELFQVEYLDDARTILRTMVNIQSDPDGVISVIVTDIDPAGAAEIANAYIEELDKLLQGMAVREAKERLAFLENERTKANIKLTRAEEALRAFSEKSSVIQIDAQTKGSIEYIATLRAGIDSKEVQLRVLRQQATPFNFDVVRLETELKGLKEKLRSAETKADQTCIGDVCISTSKVPALGLEYMRLYREAKYQEGLYQLYNRMVELARVDMIKDVAVVQVVDQAIPPERRSNRRLFPSLLVGIITFFSMIIIAFGREYWQYTAQSESEASRLAQIRIYMQGWRQDVQTLFPWRKRKKS